MMTATLRTLMITTLLAGAVACSKPSQDDCRKAVLNLQRLRGLDSSTNAPDPEAFTRKCRATGDPAVVRCIINARSEAEVNACEPNRPATPAATPTVAPPAPAPAAPAPAK